MRKLKVLISAYACEPGKGSEPLAGWQWVNAVARVADEVHVITRANNKPVLEKVQKEGALKNVVFHYLDLPPWLRFWKRGQKGVQLYYYLWQTIVAAKVYQLHAKIDFSVVHHVTLTGMQYPPGVASISDKVPFIWGPCGAVRVPSSLKPYLHPKARFLEYLHEVQFRVAQKHPLVQKAFRYAYLIIIFPNSIPLLPLQSHIVWFGHCVDLHEYDQFLRTRKVNDGHELNIVSAFRAIFWKGGDLAIEALANLKRRRIPFRWTLLGDGPELGRWMSLAKQLGLWDNVQFPGHLSRREALRVISGADVLLHPSYREGWATVIMEAMAMGLPVVCLNWGPPGYMVDNESGFRISVDQDREAIIEAIANALEALQDPHLRRRMGEKARQRALENFSTTVLNSKVQEIYEKLKS